MILSVYQFCQCFYNLWNKNNRNLTLLPNQLEAVIIFNCQWLKFPLLLMSSAVLHMGHSLKVDTCDKESKSENIANNSGIHVHMKADILCICQLKKGYFTLWFWSYANWGIKMSWKSTEIKHTSITPFQHTGQIFTHYTVIYS